MPAGTLHVLLVGAVGIKHKIIGRTDSFAMLYCGNRTERSNTANQQGPNPTWNQRFSFHIDDAVVLTVRVFNQRFLGENDELGFAAVPLDRVFAEGKVPTLSYKLQRPNGSDKGELHLELSFIPVRQRSGHGNLQGTPDPYNEKAHGSPYVPPSPPSPAVTHDPLKGPDGYFKETAKPFNSSNTKLLPLYSKIHHVGSLRLPPPKGNTHPPTMHPISEPSKATVSVPYTPSLYVQSPHVNTGGPRPCAPPRLPVCKPILSAPHLYFPESDQKPSTFDSNTPPVLNPPQDPPQYPYPSQYPCGKAYAGVPPPSVYAAYPACPRQHPGPYGGAHPAFPPKYPSSYAGVPR